MEAKKRLWVILGCIVVTVLLLGNVVSVLTLSANTKRAERTERDIGELRESIGDLAGSYQRLNDSITGVGKAIGTTQSGVTAIAGRLGTIEGRVSNLANGINGLTSSVRTAIEAGRGVQDAAAGLDETNRQFADVLRRLQEKYESVVSVESNK